MTSYADLFQSNTYPANTVPTEGSLLLVGNLSGLEPEPNIKTITIDSTETPTQGDETLDVAADVETTLRKGEVLHFSSGDPVTVASEVVVSTNLTTIDIEPLSVSPPAADDTAETWALARALSPTALPLSGESNNVDRKDYSFGLQGQEVKTRIDLSSSVELINQESDRAYHSIILPASMKSDNIFALIVTGTEHAWGPVQVSSVSDDNSIEEISRPSFDLMFQSPWARVGAYSQLSSTEQTDLNQVRKLAGLKQLS